MKFKMFLLVVAVLLMTVVSQAAVIKVLVRETDTPLMTTCGGAVALPDNYLATNIQCLCADPTSTMIWIYRDDNGNGIDYPCADNAAWWRDTYVPGGPVGGDAILPLLTTPPTCPVAVPEPGKFNINRFGMNAAAQFKPAGEFIAPRSFSPCNSYASSAPHTFYIVVTYTNPVNNDKVIYVSATFTANDVTTQQTWECTGWCCVFKTGVVPCTDPVEYDFADLGLNYLTPHPPLGWDENQKTCLTICKDHNVAICVKVGPVGFTPTDRIPHIAVDAGCNLQSPKCEADPCVGAIGFVWEGGWTRTLKADGVYMCKNITWNLDDPTRANGCVCVSFDFLEPVGMGSVAIEPGDNSVKLTWTTHSEANLDKWIVKRDNVAIYQVDATNTSTDHNYTYTDATAVNGTTYSYSLISRSSSGSEEVIRTLSATPSMDAGVVTEYALRQNYPNPFNPTTQIMYDVLNTNLVTLKIYNAAGQEVTTLVNESKTGGKRYSVNFDATNLPSGLYFYNIKIGSEFSATKKMLLVK